MATLCFNSYKGGTGKTMTSLNTAAQLAQAGMKVALVDFDFYGPALFSVFRNENKRYINEAIFGGTEVEDILVKYSHPKIEASGGGLFVGIADPNPQSIQNLNRLTDEDHKNALDQTMEMQGVLEDDLGFDMIVIDTGPGLRRDVANAIFISDVVAMVMKPTLSDLEGTKLVCEAMIQGYATDKAVGVIFNRALDKNWQPHRSLPCADQDYRRVAEMAQNFTQDSGIQVFAWVQCMCDVSRSQADRIFVLDYPDHPYAQSISECSKNILEAYNTLV